LELGVEGEIYRIRKGDSFSLKSTRRHGLRNPNRRSNAVVL
jgi:quercetin dioxygenase-like cupin family protein